MKPAAGVAPLVSPGFQIVLRVRTNEQLGVSLRDKTGPAAGMEVISVLIRNMCVVHSKVQINACKSVGCFATLAAPTLCASMCAKARRAVSSRAEMATIRQEMRRFCLQN